jgi:mannosyltransferase OCH1-like enzyme
MHLFLPESLNLYATKMDKLRKTQRLQPTTSQFGGRLPRQIQRALPIYAILIILILIISNADTLKSTSITRHSAPKRDLSQKTFKASTDFPRKIWQTWKIDPLGFAERDLLSARTWTQLNPGHRYEVLTDNNDMYYVETHFGPDGINRPDIVEMYRSLKVQIIKADLLRYLIMYVEGGVYTDIDVEGLKPVDRWIPDRYDKAEVEMVISVEIDQPEWVDHPILGKKSESFCQWTFMCKPRLPVMLTLVDNILAWLNDVAKKQKVPISEIKLDFDEVLCGTGPSAFTGAIMEQMSKNVGHKVEWDTFHAMSESKLVGGFLVLTVEAFAAGQGHSDSGNHNARGALVKHHYHASEWPLLHPRYSHPIYGEVEKCNWEPKCIQAWDANKAAFDALTPEEQAQKIAVKEALDAHDALHSQMGATKLELDKLPTINPPQAPLGEKVDLSGLSLPPKSDPAPVMKDLSLPPKQIEPKLDLTGLNLPPQPQKKEQLDPNLDLSGLASNSKPLDLNPGLNGLSLPQQPLDPNLDLSGLKLDPKLAEQKPFGK